jgi:type IV pilus assembly protein PilO
VKTPLTANPIVRIAMAVGVALLVGVVGYFALVRPEGAKLKHIKADTASAQTTLSLYHQKVAAARSAPKVQFADVYRLAKAMPSTIDMPDLLLELSQLARDSGITFDSLSPQPPVVKSGYSVVPISVTFNGTFYDLADLLYRLRTLVQVNAGHLDATGRLFSVDTMSFTEGDHGFPQITATLVVDAFVYGQLSSGGTDTTATTSTTTATTTTSTAPASTTGTSTTASTSSTNAAAGSTGVH